MRAPAVVAAAALAKELSTGHSVDWVLAPHTPSSTAATHIPDHGIVVPEINLDKPTGVSDPIRKPVLIIISIPERKKSAAVTESRNGSFPADQQRPLGIPRVGLLS